MDSIFDVIIIVSAVYLIYSAIEMKRSGSVEGSVLVSKNTDLKKAKDIPGYIGYMYRKTLVLGAVGVIDGGLGIYNSYGGGLEIFQYIFTVVFFIGIVLYGVLSVRAARKFL